MVRSLPQEIPPYSTSRGDEGTVLYYSNHFSCSFSPDQKGVDPRMHPGLPLLAPHQKRSGVTIPSLIGNSLNPVITIRPTIIICCMSTITLGMGRTRLSRSQIYHYPFLWMSASKLRLMMRKRH